MKVWDRLVRLLHWTLVIAVTTAWVSTLGLGILRAHEPAGYVALAVVSTRLLWGFVGSRYARFSQFVRRPQAVLNYAARVREHSEARYLGHNPLGGWMVVALLVCVASLGLTGWLYTTDAFWGVAWLDQLHSAMAWALLVLIALHLTGVVFTSLRHKENLVSAMFSGNKPTPQKGDVR